jgi:hypothetical protein
MKISNNCSSRRLRRRWAQPSGMKRVDYEARINAALAKIPKNFNFLE